MKWLNESMHRVLNRLTDLSMPTQIWSEDDVWRLIKAHVAHNQAIAGLVGLAIRDSYRRVLHADITPLLKK